MMENIDFERKQKIRSAKNEENGLLLTDFCIDFCYS